MICKPQSIDLERLCLEEGTRGDKWISLGRENGKYITSEQLPGGDRNGRVRLEGGWRLVRGRECRESQLELRGI